MPHKRFHVCHAQGVIDAAIVDRGHFWVETIYTPTTIRMSPSHSVKSDSLIAGLDEVINE